MVCAALAVQQRQLKQVRGRKRSTRVKTRAPEARKDDVHRLLPVRLRSARERRCCTSAHGRDVVRQMVEPALVQARQRLARLCRVSQHELAAGQARRIADLDSGSAFVALLPALVCLRRVTACVHDLR